MAGPCLAWKWGRNLHLGLEQLWVTWLQLMVGWVAWWTCDPGISHIHTFLFMYRFWVMWTPKFIYIWYYQWWTFWFCTRNLLGYVVKLLLGQSPCHEDMGSGEISVVHVAEWIIQFHRQNTYSNHWIGGWVLLRVFFGCGWIQKFLLVPGTEFWSSNQVYLICHY